MADCDGSGITTSPEPVALGGGDGAGGMDQITVVRIDDTHIAVGQSHDVVKGKDGVMEYYEVPVAVQEEAVAVAEEEEDGVYVIEYSNPEEEGESYQFTMSVDRSVPARKQAVKHHVVEEAASDPVPVMFKQARAPRSRHEVRQKRKLMAEEEVREEEVISNKSVLELGEDYSDVMKMNSDAGKGLMCSLCPPPGRLFKRGSGLAVHLKQMHQMVEKKTFYCTTCQQTVRTQIELDAHTKRHANQDAVFTCHLCSAAETESKSEAGEAGFKGSKWGLKKHLEKEHPGVIPRCDICNKGFKALSSYLADQFRHVGVSPYYCAKCQIYEMTERGLNIHVKNHDKKKKQESEENHLQTSRVSAGGDNSATDDSDF